MFRDLAMRYAFGRVVASTRGTHRGAWWLWVKWREWRRRSRWLEATAPEPEVVDELAEYMAYCGAARGTRETPIAGKLVAVNFSHKQWVGRSLPLDHFRIKAAKGGIKRAHVEGGTQQRVRRPLS